jgi:ribose transport system substrate-binding protein
MGHSLRSIGARRFFTLALVLGLVATAVAQSFFGFDPKKFSGRQLSSSTLKQMVLAATKNKPPRNGKNYVIGFANIVRSITFTQLVEAGILRNAEAAGIEVVVGDNQGSGATALQVAETFIQRNVDFVIEFQTDANFGAQIMTKMNAAKIPVVAIDIPMGEATFFGANNPYSGFLGGSYLGQAAIAKWGAAKANQAYAVIGELPQSGVVPKMRTDGQEAGIKAVLKNLPADHLIKIDTKNVLEESFKQMSNVLGRIPAGSPIIVTAINDGSTKGMLQAVKAAGRQGDLLAVGMGGDELDALLGEEQFVASVGYFPENYGNYLIPLSLMMLAGKQVPAGVLISHTMVTPMNVCKIYPDRKCVERAPKFSYKFPTALFNTFMDSLRKDPELKDYQALLK